MDLAGVSTGPKRWGRDAIVAKGRRTLSVLVAAVSVTILPVPAVPQASASHTFGRNAFVNGNVAATWNATKKEVAVTWSDSAVSSYNLTGVVQVYYGTVVTDGVIDAYGDHGGKGSYAGSSVGAGSKTFAPSAVPAGADFYVQMVWFCKYPGPCPTHGESATIIYSETVLVSVSSSGPTPTPTPSPEDPDEPEEPDPAPDAPSLPTVSIRESLDRGGMWERNPDDNNSAFPQFIVSLSRAADEHVSVNYRFGETPPRPGITEGNAILGEDYVTSPSLSVGTVTFSPDQVSETIDVAILPDTTPELDKTFTVTLEAVSANATLGAPRSVRFVILDDDGIAVPAGAITDGTGLINGEWINGYGHVDEGDVIEASIFSPIKIILSDNRSVIVLGALADLKVGDGGTLRLIRGSALYNLLPGRWKILGRGARVRVKGTILSMETSAKRDRIRTYEGSVDATGAKGKAVRVKRGFETVCPVKKACGTPKRFSPPSNPFWESPMCVSGTSCAVDGDDVSWVLDLASVTVASSPTEIEVTFVTHNPWTATDLGSNDYPAVDFDSLGGDGEDFSAYLWADDGELVGAVWSYETRTDIAPAEVEKIDDWTARLTFDRSLLQETRETWWYAYSTYVDGGQCDITPEGDLECLDWAPDRGWHVIPDTVDGPDTSVTTERRSGLSVQRARSPWESRH